MSKKDCSVKIDGVCLCAKHKLNKQQAQKFHKLRGDIEQKITQYDRASDKINLPGWIVLYLGTPQVHQKIRKALVDFFETTFKIVRFSSGLVGFGSEWVISLYK